MFSFDDFIEYVSSLDKEETKTIFVMKHLTFDKKRLLLDVMEFYKEHFKGKNLSEITEEEKEKIVDEGFEVFKKYPYEKVYNILVSSIEEIKNIQTKTGSINIKPVTKEVLEKLNNLNLIIDLVNQVMKMNFVSEAEEKNLPAQS